LNDLQILGLADREQWRELLARLPQKQQDVYFTPEYYALAEANDEGEACCIAYQHDDALALYPFLLNSIGDFVDIQGAYGYNGVITSSYAPEFIQSFHEKLTDYCRQTNVVTEFCRFHPLLSNQRFFEGYMDISLNRKTVYLDLTRGYDELWDSAYASRTRNMVRRATKAGCTAGISDDLDAFTDLYHETMQYVDAEQCFFYDLDYFQLMRKLFGKAVSFHAVWHEGVICAGALVLTHGTSAHYHLAARSSQAPVGAANLVLDEIIRYSIAQGCTTLHLGGGNSPAPDNSLLRFKKGFSDQQLEFHIGKKIHDTTSQGGN
jgi:hypothetical protein